MIVTTLPVSALAQEGGATGEETQKLDYKYERIDGQDYLTVTLPANSVEIVKEPEDPYAMRLMSITNNVPTQDGAGHLINWGAGVLWYVYDKDNNQNTTPFPPKGKKYVVELIKRVGGKNVVIAKTGEITSAAKSLRDMDPNKDTTYQFTTTDAYVVGDEKLSLAVNFPVELDQNVIYDVEQKKATGKLGGNDYNLVFLAAQSVTSNVYTAEWHTTTGALKPTLKGQIITGSNKKANVNVFDTNDKYGTIVSDSKARYIDEYNKDGKLIGLLDKYAAIGNLSIDDVIFSQGQNAVMSGQFSSYVVSVNGQPQDRPLNNRKGTIPSYTEMQADFTTGTFKQVKYPTYFYNLVGDNDHMWRFQMKEGLELKFNTGVGSATQGGQTGQDIGNTQTIAYGEKFDSALKGSFSENTLTLPETTNLVAPTLNKNNLKMKFIGWKLVQGLEVPVNPQKVETDGEGKQTLTAVTPDYADKAALETALKAADFKGFTEKNPVFYAIYGQTQGKANIKYVDDKGTVLAEDLKIQGQDYKTEKLGELKEAVTATINDAPQFKDYAISKVEIEPTTDAKYADPATATIKFVYKAKATTDDKSSDKDYIKVTFNANEGHFGTEAEKTKSIWVLKGKATFADAKGKVSNPTKDNAFFKEWQTAATGGTKVADDKTLSTADETFYASYTTKAQGKASVEYLDVKTGQAIADTFKVDGAQYPAEKEGNQGAKITADIITKDTAPKFVGYEFNRVEISPKDGTYALPATSTVKVYYNKLADVVPGHGEDGKVVPKPDGYVTVKFEPGTNGTLTGETTFYVNPKAGKTNADITEPTIKANTGFKVANPKWNPDFVAATAITADAAYTAQYTKDEDVVPVPDPTNPPKKPDGYVTVKFDLDGKGTTTNTVEFYVNPGKEVTINPPTIKGIKGYTIKKGDDAWNPKFVSKATYAKDTTFVAQYTFSSISDTEVEGFNKVTFKPGDHGTLTEKSVWVQPNTLVDISDKAPTVTANTGFSHIGWKPSLIGKFDNNSEVVAQYTSSISEKPIPGWTEILFNSGEHGRFNNGTRNVRWVDPNKEVVLKDITSTIIPYINWSFDKWTDKDGAAVDLSVAKMYKDPVAFTGTYKSNVITEEEHNKLPDNDKKNFVQITFNEGDHGKFVKEAVKVRFVKKDVAVDLTEFAPTVIPNQGYGHSGWEPALKGTFTDATTITAQYKKGTFNKEAIKDFVVLGPNKMGYGVGEKLDLTGLKVIAIDDAGLQKTYEYANGDLVDKANNNDKLGATIKVADTDVTFKDEQGKKVVTTELAMADNGKHIVVTKGQATGQSQTTLTIHENKSAKAEDVKALNQNKVVDGKVTDQPKDTTTVTGKATPGSTVIIKNEAGNQIGKVDKVGNDGTFTAEVTKQDEGKKVQVIVTEDGKQPSDPADAIVARDANNDGDDDKKADQKTATPTAKAFNQNIEEGGKVTDKPKTTTTIIGTAEKGAKVVAKVGDTIVGTSTADANTGEYTIEATKTGKPDGGVLDLNTEVKVTAQADKKLVSDPTATVVRRDADNNKKDDKGQDFDITKVEKLEIVKQPKLKYTAKDKKDGETKFKLDLKDMVIRLIDKAGKEKLTIVKDDGKFYDYDDQTKEITELKANPAHGAKLTPETSATEKGDNGKKIKVTGPNDKFVETNELQVFYDANGDDTPDYKDGQKTQAPSIMARNIGENPDKTTVEGLATPGAIIKITDKDGKAITTEPTKIVAGPDGKYTATISPKLADGTEIKATAKLGEMAESDPAVTTVFDDVNNDKTRDGQTERPAAIASNKGKTPTFTSIEVKTEKGATITVKANVPKVGSTTGEKELKDVVLKNNVATSDKSFVIEATLDSKPLPNGTEILVYAKNAPKTISNPQTTTVFNDFNEDGKPDGGKVDLTKIKDIQVIDPNKMAYVEGTDGSLDLTGLKVVVRDTLGGVGVFNYDTTANKFKDGNTALDGFTVKVEDKEVKQDTALTSAAHNKKKITVAYGDKSGETVQALKVTKTLPAPEVDPVKKGDTTVKVKVPTNGETKITVKVGDKEVVAEKDPQDGQWKVGTTPVNTVDGKLQVPVDELKQGDVVKVTTEDPAGNQGQAEKQVPVDEYSAKPTDLKAKNEPATPDKTTVTGKATPGATITIKDKNGKVLTTEPSPLKADGDGNFKATIDKKDPNTLLLVSAKEEGKEPSADVPVQVEGSKDVVPVDPNKGGTDKPEGFVTVTFAIKDTDQAKGSLEGATAYYVNPKVDVQLNPPTFKAETGFKLDGWDEAGKLILDAKKYTADTTINAVIGEVADVVPGKDPNTGKDNEKPAGYVEIAFAVDTSKGKFADNAETKFFVNPKKDVQLTAPGVTVTDLAYTMEGWDNPNWNGTDFNNAKYEVDTLISAKFKGSKVAPPKVDDVVTGDTNVKVDPGTADKVTVVVEGQGTVVVEKDPKDGDKWKTPDGKVVTPDADGKLPVPVQPITEKALVEVTVEKDGVESDKVVKTAQKVLALLVETLREGEQGITVTTNPRGAKVSVYYKDKLIKEAVTNGLGVATIILDTPMAAGQSYTVKAELDGYLPKENTVDVVGKN